MLDWHHATAASDRLRFPAGQPSGLVRCSGTSESTCGAGLGGPRPHDRRSADVPLRPAPHRRPALQRDYPPGVVARAHPSPASGATATRAPSRRRTEAGASWPSEELHLALPQRGPLLQKPVLPGREGRVDPLGDPPRPAATSRDALRRADLHRAIAHRSHHRAAGRRQDTTAVVSDTDGPCRGLLRVPSGDAVARMALPPPGGAVSPPRPELSRSQQDPGPRHSQKGIPRHEGAYSSSPMGSTDRTSSRRHPPPTRDSSFPTSAISSCRSDRTSSSTPSRCSEGILRSLATSESDSSRLSTPRPARPWRSEA